MNKFKFEKPFASFNTSARKPLKEKWRIALHDPVYLIILVSELIWFVVILSNA